MSESNKQSIARELKIFSNSIRKIILEMSLNAGSSSSHFGGALSIADIVSVLFGYKIKIEKKTQNFEDRFILSKGHACLAYYAALHKIDKISVEEIKTFEKDNSDLAGHPVKNKKLGIDFSNGSLGMGLSLGIGVAYALKKKEKNNFVYVVIGDGECNEGSVWEAAMSAPNLGLNNLYAIIDRNNFQQTGSSSDIMNLDTCVFLDYVQDRGHQNFVQCVGRALRKDDRGPELYERHRHHAPALPRQTRPRAPHPPRPPSCVLCRAARVPRGLFEPVWAPSCGEK